jgi:hypothetical protein
MRRLITIAIAIAAFTSIYAQDANNVKSFEFEAGTGVMMGSKASYESVNPGMPLFAECRLNLKDSPFDLGLQLSVGQFSREFQDHTYSLRDRLSPILYCDYNIRNESVFSPFFGIGLGEGNFEIEYPYYPTVTSNIPVEASLNAHKFILSPRIGIEVFNHLRLTLEYRLAFDKNYNFGALKLGYAFGGGKKD